MFDAVLGRASIPEGRLGTGSAIAVGLHAVVFLLALLISAPALKSRPKEPNLIVRIQRQWGTSSPSGRTQDQNGGGTTDAHKIQGGRPARRNPAPTSKPSSPAAPSSTLDQEPAGDSEGSGRGNELPCVRPPCLNAPPSNEPLSEQALPFGEGMTRPHLIQGARIEYTREASQARVQGTMILQCTLTPEGRVTDCRALKTLPFMKDAVLQAVSTWKYSPVLFQGRPVAVKYNIEIRLVAP